jgi:serine/threonine-protein kinase
MTSSAEKTIEETLHEFSALWEALALEKTALIDAGHTRTMRPSTHLDAVDTDALLRELPRLTATKGQIDFAEIRLAEIIGEGGMGKVSLARQRSVAREVVVKSLLSERQSAESTLILLREGWVTGRLEHPNIVPVYTLGRGDDGEPIIVMKKIAGVSLADLIADPGASPRALGAKQPLDFYLEILAQVCNAVHYAHSKGILHRDIKPENIMVGEFGEVYLLDWGIAVSLRESYQGRLPLASQVTSPAGTPAYMAPEMVTGSGEALSEKTDIFLLGAVLHEILTGEPPNQGGSLFKTMFNAFHAAPVDYGPAVHPELAEICRRAMHQDPARRFESADALRHALEMHLSHRDSLRLSEKSQKRLATLREMLRGEASADETGAGEQANGGQTNSEHEIYRVFGACRFGFEQALEISPENDAARRGLQEAIELLAGREIQREAYRAAALLIADLPEPNPELERRLAAMGRRLESRDREFEDLKRDQFEQDIEVGRHPRSVYAAVLGVLWGGLGIMWPISADWFGIEINPHSLLFHSVFVLALALMPALLARRALMQNIINRNVIYAVFVTVFGGAIMRALGILLDMSVMSVIALEMSADATAALVVAVFADWRVLWLAVALWTGAFLAAIFPLHAISIFGLSLMLGLCALALAWRSADACE